MDIAKSKKTWEKAIAGDLFQENLKYIDENPWYSDDMD